MGIGTAIFLSALVLSFAIIIVFTKDRVRWGKLLGITAAAVVGLATVVGAAAFVLTSYCFNRAVIHELDGVGLGQNIQDVLFKKSDFTSKCYIDDDRSSVTYEFDDPAYKARKLYVETKYDVVQRITLTGDLGYSNLKKSNSIFASDDEEDVREKWGNEDFIRSTLPQVRNYIYRRYQLNVVLRNNRAVALVIFNPELYYLSANNAPARELDCFDATGKPKVKAGTG